MIDSILLTTQVDNNEEGDPEGTCFRDIESVFDWVHFPEPRRVQFCVWGHILGDDEGSWGNLLCECDTAAEARTYAGGYARGFITESGRGILIHDDIVELPEAS